MRTDKRAEGKQRRKDDRLIYGMYAITLILIVLYILDNNVAVGVLAFIAIAATIVMEFRGSIRSEGVKKTLKDLGIAVVAVVLVVWVLPTLLLQSSSPVNVVASCSMLPSLGRGDLVLVHGISNMSQFLSTNHVPVVNVSRAQFETMMGNISSEYIEPLAYTNNDVGHVVIAPYLNGTVRDFGVGLYSIPCISRLLDAGDSQLIARCYVTPEKQASNLIKFSYAVGNVAVGQGAFPIPEIISITIANTTIFENYSNPVIVYTTVPGDTFYADYEIIHRLYAAIDVDGSYYMVTKGDNNPVIDIQAGNYPANSSQVVGYLDGRIPYLGYPSLIIKGQLSPVAQCNQTMLH